VFGAEKKARIDEEGGERSAKGIGERLAALRFALKGIHERSHVVFAHTPAIGKGGVVAENLLCRCFGVLGRFRLLEDGALFESGTEVDRSDDFFGGGEIFFEKGRAGEERGGGVVESFPACPIGREVLARVEIHSEEIAHGVVVFVSVETAQGDAAGFLGNIAGFDAIIDIREGIDELLALGIGWENVFVIGWHVAGLDLIDDIVEQGVLLKSGLQAVEVM